MCTVMVPVHDVALAVAAVVIVSIDFPYDVFGVLLIQRTLCINARVYENASTCMSGSCSIQSRCAAGTTATSA